MTEEFNLKGEIDKHYDSMSQPHKDRDYFYMSEAGKCQRSIYFDFINKKAKTFDAKTRRILENGDKMHERYIKAFAEMGILVGAELTPKSGDLVHGRCDAIITDGKQNYIIDLKSTSMWSFKSLNEPKAQDKTQLMLYMYYFNIPRGYLLYENKNDQNIKTFYIELDKPFVEKLIAQLTSLKINIDKQITPDCVGSKEKCQWCDHKLTCDKVVSI